MAEIKTSNLSFKQINAIKILDKELKRDPFLLINFNELVNDLISERESFRKQRDELINDMAETKRKAEAFDEILEITEEDCWAEDFAVYISQVIDKYKEVDHEG
ncbi:hypothetical protein K4T54_04480 [Staphylococcus epidermidis]|nr:hypothetical protein [Staphylococcus epidermidis]